MTPAALDQQLATPPRRENLAAVPVSGRIAVVVSHFDERPTGALFDLLDGLMTVDPGWPVSLRVVINSDSMQQFEFPDRFRAVDLLHQTNQGYNIGAWDAGWRREPAEEAYLFLQDECRVLQSGWAAAFVDKANQPGVGLVGERTNPRWDSPWREIERTYGRTMVPEHTVNGGSVDRITCYRDCFRRWNVDPGERGTHLQSLVLFARRAVLEAIDGFPIGANKGEAIAAEIAISKKVQNLGLEITQVGETPFCCFRHAGWT